MKITTKSLRAALTACARAADRKITLPVLSAVKLEAKDGRLIAQATNLDVWIEHVADCDGDLPPCAVNLRLLQQAVDNAQADTLELDGALTVKDGKDVTKFNTVGVVEFPAWPTGKLKPTAVNCADLAVGLDAVAWAASNGEEQRQNIENVCVLLSEHAIQCLATNAKVLAHYLKPAIASKCEFRIPVAFTAALIAGLEQPHSLLALSDAYVEASHENGKTMCKLSALEFVAGWEKIMDMRKGKPSAKVSTEAMVRLCQLCMNYHSEQRYPQLDLKWSGKVVDAEINGDVATSKQQIKAEGKGSGEAHLNAKYLTRALAKMGEQVKFTPCESASFWESGDLCVAAMQLRAPTKI